MLFGKSFPHFNFSLKKMLLISVYFEFSLIQFIHEDSEEK